jgi:ATP-binding cassette subfamily F protein 3
MRQRHSSAHCSSNTVTSSTLFYRFPEAEKLSPPILQLSEVTFGYTPEKILLKGLNIDVGLESRIAIVGANGAGKSTL